MSTLRLNVIPITDLPQVRKADPSSLPLMARVNCVLHSGQLPLQQRLEVRVNTLLQTGRAEGDQTVFTWQLFKATDEVHITVWNTGVKIRQWQGCWNERDAILHTGTLHIPIIFNGKLQPVLETTMTVSSPSVLAGASSPLAETVNGTNGQKGRAPFEHDETTMIVQDLLVIAQAKRIVPFPQEIETTLAEDQRAYEGDEGEPASPEGEEIEDHFEEYEDIVNEEGQAASVVEEQQANREAPILRAGRCIAAFHARSVELEETLQSLKDLVATLPSKTLIVDLRVQRQRQKYQEPVGLSKSLLRAVFGTSYWDRGWAIQTAYEHVPSAGTGKTARRKSVVVNPDHHPEGIPSLVQRMKEGYSLIVMDSQATYEESRRQAVIEEVQKRLSDLDVGPLR